MFWGTHPRRCSPCTALLFEVSARRGPWSCRMYNSYDYTFDIIFYCRVNLRINLLLLNCPLPRSTRSTADFANLLVVCHTRSLCILVFVRFCSAHCACHRGGIAGTLEHLAGHSRWTGELRGLSVVWVHWVRSSRLCSVEHFWGERSTSRQASGSLSASHSSSPSWNT